MKRFWVLGLILAANGCSQDEAGAAAGEGACARSSRRAVARAGCWGGRARPGGRCARTWRDEAPTLEQLRPQIRWTQKHPLARPKGFEVHFAEPVFNGRGQIDQDQITIEPALKGRFSRRNAADLEYLFSEPVSVDAVYTVRGKRFKKPAGRRSRQPAPRSPPRSRVPNSVL